jgi:phosphoenolpyruvate-protein phosphotransferase/dihydroxyacetone kinase phosphotransfer subunit
MVGLVIVSHSRGIADSLVALVRQMVGPDVPIAIAAGAGPSGSDFGTNAVEISGAIQSVFGPDGVLLLMDLGSAILSAETALDLLPEEMRQGIRFCGAPLVEGAISAAVQAGLGADLETVFQEAMKSLAPKADQLNEGAPAEAAPGGYEYPADLPFQDVKVVLRNEHGLHARPAARFVRLAAKFEAEIQVRNLTKSKGPVSARSLNALATLGAVKGDEILVMARGLEAEEGLEALKGLAETQFDDQIIVKPVIREPSQGQMLTDKGVLQGLPISEGIAIGPMFKVHPSAPGVVDYGVKDPKEAWDRLLEAKKKVGEAVASRYHTVRSSLGVSQAEIFDAQLLILEDPQLLERVHELVFQEGLGEGVSWQKAITEVADSYRSLEDSYLQQRAGDVMDVGNQVLYALSGQTVLEKIETDEKVILFAKELTPTQTAQVELEKVVGLVTVIGGPTSHSAILARTMGIPAVAGVDPRLEMVPEGTILALDGASGTLWVNPSPEVTETLKTSREKWLAYQAGLREVSKKKAETVDGRQIEVAANVGSVADAEAGRRDHSDGIGLLRTEFLFLGRTDPPSEDEQIEALHAIGRLMDDKPVVIRTMDIGGDKAVRYLQLPHEENPFLGVRGIRLSLKEDALFRVHLRAILRASFDFNGRLMLPMVADIGEVEQVQQILHDVHEDLQKDDLPHRWPIEVGIMVETPSVALLSAKFAEVVDFFSIGTNDLTQYTLAAERGNPALSGLADGMHPAVLRLVKEVVAGAERLSKWVGVCGELAQDPAAVPVLVGLGVSELSMNPGGIARVKMLIRRIRFDDAQALAETALGEKSAQAARRLAEAYVNGLEENRDD